MTQPQLDLFTTPGRSAPAPARACLPPRTRATRTPATPAVAQDVLVEIVDGRYGLLDDTDRVVVFEDTDRVRLAVDEDVVHTLTSQGYVQAHPPRDTVSCLHGAIRKPVTPLRLTASGRRLLARWSALRPLS
jgi:hypothetical protein